MIDFNEERKALIAEIELFIEEAMRTYVVERWADSYQNTKPFAYVINKKNEIWWMKTQAHQLWQFWKSAKADEVKKLEGCIVVPKSEITDWYLDEDESMYIDEPDNFLCDLEPGDVLEIKRQQCWSVDNQFATKVYTDEDNIFWEFFDSEEEAEIAAAHCKSMVEATTVKSEVQQHE